MWFSDIIGDHNYATILLPGLVGNMARYRTSVYKYFLQAVGEGKYCKTR